MLTQEASVSHSTGPARHQQVATHSAGQGMRTMGGWQCQKTAQILGWVSKLYEHLKIKMDSYKTNNG